MGWRHYWNCGGKATPLLGWGQGQGAGYCDSSGGGASAAAVSKDILKVRTGREDTIGIWLVDARGSAKHLIMPMAFPKIKNYPTPSVSIAEAETS